MSQEAVQKVIGKAVVDANFRKKLFDDPEAALADFDLTSEEIESLKNLSDEKFDGLASDLGDRISRAGGLGGSQT